MSTHVEKVKRIVQQLQKHDKSKPVSLKKKAVSHEVPKLKDKRRYDEKIDMSDLTEIIRIDPEAMTCEAESGVTFVDLVKATMKYSLVPIIVPEFKTITIGGAVAGCSIESQSFKYGGFHDTCLEYEVITAEGEVLTCTPTNENSLVFQMVHGTFGTLGIISKLKFRLIPAKKFVHVTYETYTNLEDYKKAIQRRYKNKDADFMDGIIHNTSEYVLSIGNFVDEAPYSNKYEWLKVYYLSTKKRSEDYLKTPDYFFRYDQGVTNVGPTSFLGRLFFGRLFYSTSKLKIAEMLHKFLPDDLVPITVDLFIPYKNMTRFMEWYEKEIKFFPLWVVPYRPARDYDWINSDYMNKIRDGLFIDLAIYGMKKVKGKNIYRKIEEGLFESEGLKTLISDNHYTEDEFWSIWNKDNFMKVKSKTDPSNIFRNLYTKTCKIMRGIE
jgi:hypothetical protein